AFGGVGDEEVVVGEGVVVTSLSLDMLTNSCLGGIMVSLIFLEGLEQEAWVEFMVELFEKDEDAASDVAATSSPATVGQLRSTPVNAAGQRRSTPPATGQRRRVTMAVPNILGAAGDMGSALSEAFWT
nr:hypothetical protein [Tanacetum cinerariifolium]